MHEPLLPIKLAQDRSELETAGELYLQNPTPPHGAGGVGGMVSGQ